MSDTDARDGNPPPSDGVPFPPPPGWSVPEPPTEARRPGGALPGGVDPAGPEAPPPASWRPIEVLPVFVIAIVVALLASVPLAAIQDRRAPLFVATSLIGELAFGATVLAWVHLVDHGPLAALGRPRHPWKDVGTGVLAGAMLTVVAIISSLVVIAVATAILGHRPAQPDQIPDYVSGVAFALSGLVVVFAAPFGEELLFRGFFYKSLRRRWSVWPSVLLSSAGFALLHGQPVLIFAILPVGIGLALVYEWRQSILASMAAHATFNLIGFITIAATRH